MAAAVIVPEGTDSQKRTEFQDTEGNRFYFFTNSFGGISLVSSCYCDGNFTGVCIDLFTVKPAFQCLVQYNGNYAGGLCNSVWNGCRTFDNAYVRVLTVNADYYGQSKIYRAEK